MSLSRLAAALAPAALATLVASQPIAAQAGPPTISPIFHGEAALARHEISTAESFFRLAARDSNAARRAIAERMLGVVDWRFHHDYAGARRHYTRALATGRDSTRTLVEASRLAVIEGRYRDAAAMAEQGAAVAHDLEARRAAWLQMAAAVVEPHLVERVDHVGIKAEDRPDSAIARTLLPLLLAEVHARPGRIADAQQLLLVALIEGDGAAALEGWRSYYLVDGGESTRSLLPGPRHVLEALLPRWNPTSTSRADRERVVRALADSRLFAAAALVATSGPRRSLSAYESEIVAYAAYCRQLAREFNEYYRRTLSGEARRDELLRTYYRASHDLWPKLDWSNRPPPPYFPAAVAPELSRRFGAVITFGITGGFYDVHMGHRVADEAVVFELYGARARLRYFLLDGMVTNGLQSWAWDTEGAHGGWQRGDTIVQVRPVYADGAFTLLLSLDSLQRERERSAIAFDSLADVRLAAVDSIAFLPGVVARLRRDGRDALFDSLRHTALAKREVDSVFSAIVSRVTRESAIIAHEGRHALDERSPTPLVPAEREFRAKLSEVAQSSRPKLILSSIVHPNIGDATPHGQANARIMLGLIRWMRVHAAEIAGFDGSQPVLPQLPLLTDDQLRQAFRSMDPMAR